MENGLTMTWHAVVITFILYVFMRFGLKQGQRMAINRSILLGAVSLVYMMLYGHKLPF